MSAQAEILANLERMAAQQAALAEKRMREAEEKLHQMRKAQERANHLARYIKGDININPLPQEVIAPAGRSMHFDPKLGEL
jgi:thioesterase domain-containing protein